MFSFLNLAKRVFFRISNLSGFAFTFASLLHALKIVLRSILNHENAFPFTLILSYVLTWRSPFVVIDLTRFPVFYCFFYYRPGYDTFKNSFFQIFCRVYRNEQLDKKQFSKEYHMVLNEKTMQVIFVSSSVNYSYR